MAEKVQVATAIIEYATEMKGVADKFAALHSYYFDNGLNAAGSDPITDQDVAQTGITAAKIGDVINFAGHMATWLNGGDPFNADWDATLNQARSVNHLG